MQIDSDVLLPLVADPEPSSATLPPSVPSSTKEVQSADLKPEDSLEVYLATLKGEARKNFIAAYLEFANAFQRYVNTVPAFEAAFRKLFKEYQGSIIFDNEQKKMLDNALIPIILNIEKKYSLTRDQCDKLGHELSKFLWIFPMNI